MAKPLAQGIVTIISLIVLAACSVKPALHKTDGQSQASQPSKPLPTHEDNPLLASPMDDADQAYPSFRPSDEFPRPRELEPQVGFWRKAYATWGQSQIAIHDKRHMNIVYEVLPLPGEVYESLTPSQKDLIQERMDYWRNRLDDLETKLSAGMRLGADEQRLAHQIAQNAGDQTAIYGASQRLRYQRGLRERFKKGLAISRLYDRQFREIFRNAGLPEDLALLPHVESSFQANAHSSAGALGIWQFTAGAARIFMNGDDSVEARLDPIASAYGAARYLSQAYDKLGSWPLAVTSYNHGIGGMQRARARFGQDFPSIVKHYDHPQFGFASRNYYAEFLAARDIASDPERFFAEGLSNEDRSNWEDASLVTDTLGTPAPEPQDTFSPSDAVSEVQTQPADAVLAEASSVGDVPPSEAPEARQDPFSPSDAVSEVQTQPADAVLAEASSVEDDSTSEAPEALQDPFPPSDAVSEAQTEPTNAPLKKKTGSATKTVIPPPPQPRKTSNSLKGVNAAKAEPTKAEPLAPKKLATNSPSKVVPLGPKPSKGAAASKEKPIKQALGGAQRVAPQKAAARSSEPKLLAKNSSRPVVASDRREELAAKTHSMPVNASMKHRPK